MAKPIKIPAQIDLSIHNLKDIRDQLNILNESIGKNLSEKAASQLVDLSSFIDDFIKKNEKSFESGKTKPEDLKEIVKTINEITTATGRAHKAIGKELSASPHSFFSPEQKQTIKEIGDEIVKVDNQIDATLKAKEAREAKNLESIKTSTKYTQFALGNLVNYDAIINKLTKDEATYQRLREKQKDGKLNSTERQRLEVLKETSKARSHHLKQAQKSADLTEKETETIQNLAEQLIELKNRLADVEKQGVADVLGKVSKPMKEIGEAGVEGKIQFSELQAELDKSGLSLNIFSNLLNSSKKNLVGFLTGIISGKLLITGLNRTFKETIKVIQELDKSFNEIAMVTTMTTKEAWRLRDSFVEIASVTGKTTTEVAELSVQFFRQGRSISETLKLTEAAASAATIAGISVTDSVNYLTSAINGFHLSANQAMVVSDKFAALAASSASSYEELAKALSKVAAQAYTVGVNMDSLMGFIAKGLEVTREAPENIGTAFKTIFARMAELKDLGKTMEDGMSIGRVDSALKQIGISLRNTNGEIRNLDEVLIELGHSWDTLTKNQKAYVAVALAGTRQQARLLAVMEDFGRTMDLVEVSQNSLGATLAQQAEYANSMAYALNEIKVAWQDFVGSLSSSPVIILFYKSLSTALKVVNSFNKALGGFGIVIAGVAIALAALSMKMGMASTQTIAMTLSAYAAAKAEGTLTGSILKNTVATLWNTSAIKRGIAALNIKTAAAQAANTAMAGLSTTVGLVAVGLVALAGVIYLVATENDRMIKSIKKTQAEIYNLRKKTSDINTLVNEYDKLDKKIDKTNEDLERQKELMEQIQDLTGDDLNAVGLDGKLNRAAALGYSEEQNRKANEDMRKEIEKTIRTHGSLEKAHAAAVKSNDAITQEWLILAKAISLAGTSLGDYYETLSEYERKMFDLEAKLNMSHERIFGERQSYEVKKSVGTTSHTLVFYDEKEAKKYADSIGTTYEAILRENEDITEEYVKKSMESIRNMYAEGLGESSFKDQIDIFYEFVGDMPEESRKAAEAIVPEFNNIKTAAELLANAFGTSFERGEESLRRLVNSTTISSKNIVDLSQFLSNNPIFKDNDTLRGQLFADMLDRGVIPALKSFQREIAGANISTYEYYTFLGQVTDLIGAKTIEELGGLATGLNSVYENLEKVNAMITNQQEYDLVFINEMMELYPQLADLIKDGQEIEMEGIHAMAEEKREEFKKDINRKKEEINIQIGLNNERIAYLQEALAVESRLENLNAKEKKELEKALNENLGKAAEFFHQRKSRVSTQYTKETIAKELELEAQKYEALGEYEAAARAKYARGAVLSASGSVNVDTMFEDVDAGRISSFSQAAKAEIEGLVRRNQLLEGQLINLDAILTRVDKSGSLRAQNTKEAAKAAKEYEGQITALYIALQQLAALEHELSDLETRRKYTKSGEEYVALTTSINQGLAEKNKVIAEINRLQSQEQQYTLDSLGSLNKYVKVVNGKLKIAISDYNKLKDDEKKLIDDTIKDYDQLTDSINQNSIAIKENTAEIEANNKILRDKTIELHNLLAEALKNQKKKELDIIKKGIAEERKLLDERRKLYEDSFSEEDYLDELGEIDEERQDVINQLAQLEGATGAAANKKRQELLEKKADLDKQYNTKVRDYNREALFESIQMEQEALNQKEQDAQDYYDQYVSDTERLQEDINRILEKGVDETVQFLKDHHESYIGALELAKGDLEEEWRFLAGQVEGAGLAVEGLPEEWKLKYDIPDFVAITNNVASLIDELKKIPKNTSTTHTNYSQNVTLPPKNEGNDKKEDYVTSVRVVEENKGGGRIDTVEITTWAIKGPVRKTLSSRVAGGQTYTAFASGGEADFTGPMWVDGTKRRPERILSPVQTELFNRMVSQLERSGGPIGQDFNLGPINVNLATGSTSEAREAASRIYDELKSVMKSRGLVANTKITKY